VIATLPAPIATTPDLPFKQNGFAHVAKGFGKGALLMAAKSIRLRCSVCGFEETTNRMRSDPEKAALMVLICPDCDDGDFHSASYWDADGNEVMFDE
jgi:hypothetical protein